MKVGKNLLLLITVSTLLFATVSSFAFSYKNNRYPSPSGFYRLLGQKFPHAFNTSTGIEECATTGFQDESNRIDFRLLGLNDPATGLPSIGEPDQAFLAWYAGCMKNIIGRDFEGSLKLDSFSETPKTSAEEGISRYLDDRVFTIPELQNQLKQVTAVSQNKAQRTLFLNFYSDLKWGTILPDVQVSVIQHLINNFIGPHVLSSEAEQKLRTRIQKRLSALQDSSLFEVIREAVLGLTLYDAFLLSPE